MPVGLGSKDISSAQYLCHTNFQSPATLKLPQLSHFLVDAFFIFVLLFWKMVFGIKQAV